MHFIFLGFISIYKEKSYILVDHMGVFRFCRFTCRALSVVVLAVVGAWANPQVHVSSVSVDDVRAHLDELKRMNADRLDESSKEELYRLWEQASEIAELNDRCSEISLSEMLDDRCQRFYEVELPNFEASYTQLTGEVRMNSLRLGVAMDDKRAAIEACFEAFPLGDFNLSKVLDVNGDVIPEPLDEGRTEVTYRFRVAWNQDRKEAFEEMVASWYNTCREHIMRSDGSGELAPLFMQRLESSKGFGIYGLQGKNPYENSGYGLRGTEVWLVLKKNINAEYRLNGKWLFSKPYIWGERIVGFNFSNGHIYYSNSLQDSFNGKVVLSEEESRHGLYGRLEWKGGSGKAKNRNSGSSVSSGSRESDASGSLVRFFLRIGLSLGLDGPLDGMREKHPDVWTGDYDEIPDTSFFRGQVFMTAAVRLQGDVGFIGIGGGGAFYWMSAEVPDVVSYGRVQETKTEYLEVGFYPIALAEMGIFMGAAREWELGVRETYMYDPTMPMSHLGGFFTFFYLTMEVGWAYSPDYVSGVYFNFVGQIPLN